MKLILIVVIVSIYGSLMAQVVCFGTYPKDMSKLHIVDSTGFFRAFYAMNATDIKDPNTYDDLHRLEVGQSRSMYYSYFVYKSDSLVTEWGKANPHAATAPNHMHSFGKQSGKWSEYYFTYYQKNFENGRFTEFVRLPRNLRPYRFNEDIPIQQWEIHEETAIVAGYQCQKATTRFRGRSYVAWFTPEIPINNGPWKFGGLPGLILKVYDEDVLFTFECTKIEYFRNTFHIQAPLSLFHFHFQDDYQRHRRLMANIWEDCYRATGWIMNGPNPDANEIGSYQPLELE